MSVQPLVPMVSPKPAAPRPLRLVPEEDGQRQARSSGGVARRSQPLRFVRPLDLAARQPETVSTAVYARSEHVRPQGRTSFDIAFNIAAVTVIALALLVLGMVLAIISSPEAGSFASTAANHSVVRLGDVLSSGVAASAIG